MKKLIATLFVFASLVVALIAEEKINVFKTDLSVLQFPTASVNSLKVEGNHTELVVYKSDKTSECIPLLLIDSITLSDEPDIPLKLAVKTTTASNITYNSVGIGALVESVGSSPILERGIVWNTLSNPTINRNKKSLGKMIRKDASRFRVWKVTRYTMHALLRHRKAVKRSMEMK